LQKEIEKAILTHKRICPLPLPFPQELNIKYLWETNLNGFILKALFLKVPI
jgi:hypothetical protein